MPWLWFDLVQWVPRNDGAKIGSWLPWCMVISEMSKFDQNLTLTHGTEIEAWKSETEGIFLSILLVISLRINIQILDTESFKVARVHCGECFAPIRVQVNWKSVHGVISLKLAAMVHDISEMSKLMTPCTDFLFT